MEPKNPNRPGSSISDPNQLGNTSGTDQPHGANQPDPHTTAIIECQQLLDALSDQELRAFLTDLAQRDTNVRYQINLRYGTPDPKQLKENMVSAIKDAKQHYIYQGFVDYRDSLGFEEEVISAYLTATEPLLKPAYLADAFEVTWAFVKQIDRVHIDDSNGFVSEAVHLCLKNWDQILTLAPQAADGKKVANALFRKLFDYAKKNLSSDRYEIQTHLSDQILDFLIDHFIGNVEEASAPSNVTYLPFATSDGATTANTTDASSKAAAANVPARTTASAARTAASKQATALADYVNSQVEEVKAQAAENRYYSRYRLRTWIRRQLKVMGAQGASAYLRLQVAIPYLDDASICDLFAEEALTFKNPNDGIALLLKTRTLIRENPCDDPRRRVNAETLFAAELAQLYEAAGNKEQTIAELSVLVTHGLSFSAHQEDPFIKLRNQLPADQWPAFRDKLLPKIRYDRYRRECLTAEGLHERLMNDIETARTYGERLDEVRKYRNELVPLFPDRAAAVFRQGVLNHLETNAAERRTYQRVRKMMKEMEKAGLAEATQALANEIRGIYPRRPSLLDELTKGGW